MEVPIQHSDPTNKGKRRRQYFHSSPSVSVFLPTFAALTVAVSYLWVSPAAGYLFPSAARTPAVERSGTREYPDVAHQNYAQIPTFGIRQINGWSSATRLQMAPGGSYSDKEEWRAVLASFQLYKAAYGDLKIPTRFVVPSMTPWPGKYL